MLITRSTSRVTPSSDISGQLWINLPRPKIEPTYPSCPASLTTVPYYRVLLLVGNVITLFMIY